MEGAVASPVVFRWRYEVSGDPVRSYPLLFHSNPWPTCCSLILAVVVGDDPWDLSVPYGLVDLVDLWGPVEVSGLSGLSCLSGPVELWGLLDLDSGRKGRGCRRCPGPGRVVHQLYLSDETSESW